MRDTKLKNILELYHLAKTEYERAKENYDDAVESYKSFLDFKISLSVVDKKAARAELSTARRKAADTCKTAKDNLKHAGKLLSEIAILADKRLHYLSRPDVNKPLED